jgi:hypothetical protein
VERTFSGDYNKAEGLKQQVRAVRSGGTERVTLGRTEQIERRITGYACACPTPDAPTRPAVVLDPFGGTGTVAGVAHKLGRLGISVDLSQDYIDLARWRIHESGHFPKIAN